VFHGNTYDQNIAYGLDPHDDSDYLTITGNVFSRNGNHGFICSQRCDHLTIKGNRSEGNVSTTADAHGIMLHRGVTDTVVEDNTIIGNSSGGGIVVFDSVGNTIKNNTIAGNKYGLRFSVGTKDLTVSGNSVKDSVQHALYTYKGSDVASYTGTSGRPTGITFTDNVFAGAGAELFKVQDSDNFTFRGGSVTPGDLVRGPKFERAGGHAYDKSVVTPAGTTFVLRGTSIAKTSVDFTGFAPTDITVDKDAFSTATFDEVARQSRSPA
jgi:mannuronan 5-epimerase